MGASLVGFAAAAAVSVLVAGCAAGAPAPAPAPATTSSRPDPVAGCARQLEYWAGEQLRGAPDQGYDYQHMGLSGDQNDALGRIVARARTEGAGVVPELARAECARIATLPSSAPWGTGSTP